MTLDKTQTRWTSGAVAIVASALIFGVGCAPVGQSDKKDGLPTGDKAVAGAPVEDDGGGSDPGDGFVDDGPGSDAPPERPETGGKKVDLSSEAEAAIERANEQIADGNLSGARDTLDALSSDPEAGFLARYNLGVISDREGKTEEARNNFQESLRLNPDFSPALVSLCRLHLRGGNSGLAVQTAERFANSQPDNLGHADARLQVLVAAGRFEEVIRDAKKVLKRDERNVRAMVNLAHAYHRLGKHELSEDVLLQVEEIAKEAAVLSEVRYLLGFVYLAMDNETKARSSFEKAVEKRPDFAEARNNLGVLYHKARDYDSAIDQFKRAVDIWPGYKEAHLNLGNAYKGQKEFSAAEGSFQQAMRIDPAFGQAYFNLGILYLDAIFDGRDKKEQYQLAIDNFNRYKVEMKASLPREDPADQYIEEAKKKIELELKREQMRREAAMEAEEDEGDDFDEEEGDDFDLEEDGEEGSEEDDFDLEEDEDDK